jgi:hypothetical protein
MVAIPRGLTELQVPTETADGGNGSEARGASTSGSERVSAGSGVRDQAGPHSNDGAGRPDLDRARRSASNGAARDPDPAAGPIAVRSREGEVAQQQRTVAGTPAGTLWPAAVGSFADGQTTCTACTAQDLVHVLMLSAHVPHPLHVRCFCHYLSSHIRCPTSQDCNQFCTCSNLAIQADSQSAVLALFFTIQKTSS